VTEEDAKAWNQEHPEAPVSVFACRFPGKYREAADLLRKVRREEKEHNE